MVKWVDEKSANVTRENAENRKQRADRWLARSRLSSMCVEVGEDE